MTAAPSWSCSKRVSRLHISNASRYSRMGYARGRQPGGMSLEYCLRESGVVCGEANIFPTELQVSTVP
eukprot:9468781-Pyramimonas_sp.AAC.1